MDTPDNDESDRAHSLRIALVGPCGAGKTTIRSALIILGYTNIRHVAQEHSYVPDMWRRLTNPDVLIFLDVSYQNATLRRDLRWSVQEYEQQLFRLRHARQHADLVLDTNHLSVAEVIQAIQAYLAKHFSAS